MNKMPKWWNKCRKRINNQLANKSFLLSSPIFSSLTLNMIIMMIFALTRNKFIYNQPLITTTFITGKRHLYWGHFSYIFLLFSNCDVTKGFNIFLQGCLKLTIYDYITYNSKSSECKTNEFLFQIVFLFIHIKKSVKIT